jgi:hypothetical protein
MPGLTTKPRLDSPWLSLICAFFFCYGIALFHLWRRAKTSLRPRLTLLDFSHFLLLGCLAWWAWQGQNLVLTCLDFAWFVRFSQILVILILDYRIAVVSYVIVGYVVVFLVILILDCRIVCYRMLCYCGLCLDYRISYPWLWCSLSLSVACFLIFPYRSLDRPFPYPYPCLAWRRAKTSFWLGSTLLDFRYFIAYVSLDFMCSEGRKPRSDLAWLCLIFVFFFVVGKLRIAMVDGCGEDKTSFGIGLILLDFCYLIAIVVSCYLIVACRIRCLVIVSYRSVAYRILIVVSGYRIGCLAMVS